jgi:hypothetical protein
MVFGADAAPVSGGNPQKNARILVATYQTLDVDTADADANFLTTHYPENYFSHIVIDECHRSAWGKWSQVLTRNPEAVQIGLTATPRKLEVTEESKEAQADARVSADNLARHPPVRRRVHQPPHPTPQGVADAGPRPRRRDSQRPRAAVRSRGYRRSGAS